MYGYIYKTTNIINGKIYIGQHKSNNFLKEHYYIGSGKLLKIAIQKYGKENFKCELLEECDSKELLDIREKYWITYYNSTDKEIGYNISSGGNVPCMIGINNPFYGKKHSKETLEKMRNKKVSTYTKELLKIICTEIAQNRSQEEKERISNLLSKKCKGQLNGMYNKKHSEKAKEAQRQKALERPPREQSQEERLKRSNTLKGHSVSEETKRKISETLKAKNKLKSNKEN